ncbi:MAG TPA: thiol reductant ABC exporter subunit CydD [Solirubrobacteraceae bacterium]|jgi:thiol reductant ABC exporter CydD subunit
MRAIDPRLLHYARSTKTFLYLSVALGILAAVLIVAQASLLAEVVVGAFKSDKGLRELQGPLVALLCVAVARAVVAWAAELAAARSSARAKSQLRGALLGRVAQVGIDSSRESSTGELATLATRGIDALDAWFSLYLPQVVLATIVPLAVLAAIFTGDWISGVIVAFTIPLIPLFMVLVGASTRERMDLQVSTLQRLAGHFLDVVGGLATLKVFGRATAQGRSIREVSERYRTTALYTLRVSFLSSLILELVASISVALVAVAIGLRLMSGAMALQSALFVLVLAPEAYLPLRRLGANYHASAEGMAAAEQVFAVLEAPLPPRGTRTHVPNPALTGIAIEGLTIAYPGRGEPAVQDFSLTVEPGETVALAGPSGCGKSSVLSVLLGFLAPERGMVRIGDVNLALLDPDAWREQIAWMPQRPHLFAGTIAENVRIGREGASMKEIQAACSRAGLDRVEVNLERGLATELGDRGAGLSAGERQRVALARAFLRDTPLLLLDEPTASLDGETEERVIESVRELCEGRTVLLVAHRPALIEMADRVVSVGAMEAVA